MPTGTEVNSFSDKKAEIAIKPETLETFTEFMKVNMRLEKRTVRETKANIRRFLEGSNYAVTYEKVSAYLSARERFGEISGTTYQQVYTHLIPRIRPILRDLDIEV